MKSLLPSPLKIQEWPVTDQQAWELGMNGHPLHAAGGGGGAHWRPSTRQQNAAGYGGWLAWLMDRGLLDEAQCPAARASRENVTEYLSALEEVGLADYTRAGRLQQLSDVLRIMRPEVDRRFIAIGAKRIAAEARRSRDLQPRMRPPVEVLKLGLDLMRQASAEEQPLAPLEKAYLYRDGLLIAFLANSPTRVSNLAAIRLGRHLVATGSGYRLEFPAGEMKGRRHFSFIWPPKLLAALACYLETYRPILLERRKAPGLESALWVSQFGKGMTSGSIGQIIRIRTNARFGAGFGPHFVRYLTATYLADREPEHIADVAAVLAHSSLETSEQHYILANSRRVIAKFQQVLSSRLQETVRER